MSMGLKLGAVGLSLDLGLGLSAELRLGVGLGARMGGLGAYRWGASGRECAEVGVVGDEERCVW